MEKEKLFCYGNSKNVGMLLGKCGYFAGSEEEIQQQIDSGAAVRECDKISIGKSYCAFTPKPEVSGQVATPYSYFYCVDFIAEKPASKMLICPGTEAPLEDMQAYAHQQLKIILHQIDNPSLQFIYEYAKSLQTKNDTAKELFTALQFWYNTKQQQLHDFLIEEISNEEYITSDVLRSYADKLDEVDSLELLEENFDSLQELLNEYNL